jgi:eukaryotic-like serine/threonine-protein kinase
MIGRTLSHFRVVDRIGEGGMGVVFRAEDERLGRAVALKVLPPERLADEEHRLRFLREARAAAAVTHPNIATVHEIGEAGGVVFIAMELVEGRTLREAIGGKPLSLREAVRLAAEIADGLAAAHAAKVVHRDLKPDNVIVTADGRVKILDFGLAKLLDERREREPGEASRLATISNEMTQAGRVLGTTAYMSPEQARGLPVDARSDVFSFGVVLYEMITGKPPFRGSTTMDTLTAILREQPVPPVELNPEVPPELTRIIGKCLEKEPGERYQDTRDLLVDLRRLKRDSDSRPLPEAESTAPSVPVPARRGFSMWIVAAGLAIVVPIAVLYLVPLLYRGGRRADGAASGSRAVMTMRRLARIENLAGAALSPDGKFLAYVARKEGKFELSIRQVGTGSDIEVVPPQNAVVSGLEFSPDGDYLYYLSREQDASIYNTLFRVPSLGGTPRKLLFDVDSSVAFSPDGKRIAFLRGQPDDQIPKSALMIADADGANPRQIASKSFPAFFGYPTGPTWSPDGRRIAAPVWRSGSPATVVISEFAVADGGETTLGTKTWSQIYAMAWLPDRSGLVVIGGDRVEPVSPLWLVAYPRGDVRRITNDLNAYVGLNVSADGKSLATVQVTSAGDVWAAPAADPSAANQITSGEGPAFVPYVVPLYFASSSTLAATPSGSIVFETKRAGPSQLWTMAPDGSERRRLSPEGMEASAPRVARATGRVAFDGRGPDLHSRVFRMEADGSNVAAVTGDSDEGVAAVSPDGEWLLYRKAADPSVWKVPLAGGPSKRIEIDRAATFNPCYSPRGKTLWVGDLVQGAGRMEIEFVEMSSADVPTGRRLACPAVCEIFLPWKLSPSGEAFECLGELDGVYNLWSTPLAGGEPRPVTRFKSGHVLDFDWSPDGKRLFLWRGDATTDVVLITNFE